MDESEQRESPHGRDLLRRVEQASARRRHGRRGRREPLWLGLGMFGLVGWSVAVPTLLGVALGVWLDAEHPGGRSWTLTLLVAGLLLGCANAWYWVQRARREIDRLKEEGEQKQEREGEEA